MSGTLYLVATPIGNLGDLSPRGVQTLQEADFIAAEDTRVSMKLLNHFDIKKPLVSYHEHNRAAAGQSILARLLAGETCALVTDAGTPAISDPGEDLVRLCGENGVTVQAIPGCCAAVCALAVSGLPTGRFTFEGFLSANKKERREALTRLAAELRQRGLRPDVICVDPPRKGLAPDVVEAAASMTPGRIVYVSCDPATLARDVARFAPLGYRPVRACAVDLFPGTAHVETVCLLSRETDPHSIS